MIAVVGAVVLATTSAAWACHPLLSGMTRCASHGDQVVTWSIGNSESKQSMTIIAAFANVGATPYAVVGYRTVVARSGSTSATTTVPRSVTGTIVLTVTGAWRHHVVATRHVSVVLGGTCAPPPTTTTTTTTTPPTTTTVEVTTATTEPPAATTTTQPPVRTTTTPTPTTVVTPTTETAATVVVKTVTTVAPTTSTTATTAPPTTPTVRSRARPTASATPAKPGGALPWTGMSAGPLLIALGSIFFGLTAFALQSSRISISLRTPRR